METASPQDDSLYWKEGTRNRKNSLVMFKTLVQKNKSNCKSSATMSLDIEETFSDPSG